MEKITALLTIFVIVNAISRPFFLSEFITESSELRCIHRMFGFRLFSIVSALISKECVFERVLLTPSKISYGLLISTAQATSSYLVKLFELCCTLLTGV